MLDGDEDRGAISGTNTLQGNRSTGRKPAPVPLSPPSSPHDLSRDGTPEINQN
jgi:hypothetical protein